MSIALGLQFALVPPVAACSCIGPQPMDAYAGDETVAVFTAIVEPRDARGFPATVTRWFQGGSILDPRVWFDVGGFNVQPGVMSSCGMDPLPVGGQFIFVAYRIEASNNLGMGLCSPHAPLAAPEGQAMLADAERTFVGKPVAPITTDPPITDPPTPSASPGSSVVLESAVPIVIALVAAVGVLFGVFAVVGRRRDPGSGADGD